MQPIGELPAPAPAKTAPVHLQVQPVAQMQMQPAMEMSPGGSQQQHPAARVRGGGAGKGCLLGCLGCCICCGSFAHADIPTNVLITTFPFFRMLRRHMRVFRRYHMLPVRDVLLRRPNHTIRRRHRIKRAQGVVASHFIRVSIYALHISSDAQRTVATHREEPKLYFLAMLSRSWCQDDRYSEQLCRNLTS
ncbi:hypothetical protein BD626DRAFT_61822 [Schizophyllum amplum]|uniref:Uncharacterized protein n=1 Tax=Schizophyllum amplum TaxID=97359 RepID=A0A550BSG4_9AGAR|nr:hypothetical protein BD626DRAFT_61822 [Auriculariopsis ampla]